MSKFCAKIVNAALFIAGASVQMYSQGAGKPDDSTFGSFGMIIGVLFAVAAGFGAIVLLRRKDSATKLESIISENEKGPNGLKPGEIRMTFKETKKEKPAKRPAERKIETADVQEIRVVPKPPVYEFVRLERSAPFIQLKESDDESLLCAIDQTLEESEDDTVIRELALKVLAAFKTSNAVSAISQMALYDLSAPLRSHAVSVLADIDHESVFETVVLAGADPTREVRAAAARGLVRLSFDRAHAWTRIIESEDIGRMRQAARAAIEGDLVERSFARLAHKDKKVAYEAFALTALLIKSGETEAVYRSLGESKDEEVMMALLHVVQVMKTESTFQSLSELLIHHELTPNVAAKVNEVRSYSQLMNA